MIVSFVSQECLNGEFVRVGPNPKFDAVAGYHWHVLFFFFHFYSIQLFIMVASYLY